MNINHSFVDALASKFIRRHLTMNTDHSINILSTNHSINIHIEHQSFH